MEFTKYIVFLWLIPAVTYGQTVHVDSNRIVYKGTVESGSVNKDELYGRAKNAIHSNVKASEDMIIYNYEKGMISVTGSIKLASPYHIIRTVAYVLELSVTDGKYEYRIDSVYIKQAERGGKTTKISSGELLKGMEVSGPVSASAEKQLNEIDMNFQRLIDLIGISMKKAAVVEKPK